MSTGEGQGEKQALSLKGIRGGVEELFVRKAIRFHRRNNKKKEEEEVIKDQQESWLRQEKYTRESCKVNACKSNTSFCRKEQLSFSIKGCKIAEDDRKYENR